MADFGLTGIDSSNPTPGVLREIASNRGPSGGAVSSRDVVIMGNKVASVGSASVDGLGDALDTPIKIGGGTDEVIQRFGRKSELLLLAKTFWRHNGTASQLYLQCAPLGAGSAATKSPVFATNADRVGVIQVDFAGDQLQVGVASGETPTVVALRVSNAINAKEDWPLTCVPTAGTLAVSASMVGGRFDHYVSHLRIRFLTTNAMTISSPATTTGGADDDQTNSILGLGNFNIYYHVNPKGTTAGVTSTDNGIGEHSAAMADWISPAQGKAAVLVTGQVGTPAQAVTVASSINAMNAFHVHAENNDYSPGMIAAAFAGALARAEASDRAANMVDYGDRGNAADRWFIPDPFAKSDRATQAEIITLLNGGVTPIAFSASGRARIVWHVTTNCLSGSNPEYRSRPGHAPSVRFDFWDSLRSSHQAVAQPKYSSDPLPGQNPLPGFTYPRDIKAIVVQTIDRKLTGQPATLDPEKRQAMIDSIVVQDNNNAGLSCRVDIFGVRHLLKAHYLIQDTSPSI